MDVKTWNSMISQLRCILDIILIIAIKLDMFSCYECKVSVRLDGWDGSWGGAFSTLGQVPAHISQHTSDIHVMFCIIIMLYCRIIET